MPKRDCRSASVVPDCMVRNSSASAAALNPGGGVTNTARRGSQPTCTAPSGRNSTGVAGLSVNRDEPIARRALEPGMDRLCHGQHRTPRVIHRGLRL